MTTRVQFSSEIDQLLLPMRHSYTNGVKTAKVIRLRKVEEKSTPGLKSTTPKRRVSLNGLKGIKKSSILKLKRNVSNSKWTNINGHCTSEAPTIQKWLEKREYSCGYCGRQFFHRQTLLSHMLLHSGASATDIPIIPSPTQNHINHMMTPKESKFSKIHKKLGKSPKSLLKKHFGKTAGLLQKFIYN